MTLRDNRIQGNSGAPVFASATSGGAVTPHDTNDNIFMALWIGGAGSGNLKVTTPGGDTLTFSGVTVGFFPVATSVILDTGTDVTDIVGLNW